MGLGVARCAPYWCSELSGCSIRRLLLADVCSDLFQFEPDGRYCVIASPEMLARKVALLAAQASDGDRTLPFEKSDHRCHRVFGGNGDAHMHVIRHQMTLDNLAFLFAGPARGRSHPIAGALGTENGLPTPFGHENYWYLQSHLE